MKDQWLAHTKARLESGELRVGFLGGSITWGSGASDPEGTSWRAGVTGWLKDTYPGATVTGVNAALGGTGSDLGAFRCRRDLVSKLPDLVFVEFSVNDSGMERDWCQRSMEGIVRHLWGHRGDIDIVFVYTAVKGFEEDYRAGRLPRTASWHQELADYYGIPSVNVGRTLYDAVQGGTDVWDALLPDGVHPSDTGYGLYTAAITGFLKDALNSASDEPLEIALPRPMTVQPLWDGHLLDSWKVPEAQALGWSRVERDLCGAYPHYLEATKSGSELTVSFDGTTVGVFWMVSSDSGDIEWSVDGGEARVCRCWDEWGKAFDRANYRILADGLEPGEHLLRIRVLQDKAPESGGTAIRIGAFLVAGRSKAEQPMEGPSVDFRHGNVRVDPGGRFLCHDDGTPFFWLGDTAWELFHRSTREEATFYLEDRRQKGFTAVQAVILAETDGLTVSNAYGHVPLEGNDPTKPDEGYFGHVDFVVETALSKGICMAILPTWADKVGPIAWGSGPVVLDEVKAAAFGRFLGNRYKAFPNIVWVLGGDRSAEGYENVWRAMARGIREGDGGGHPMTFHPWGESSSATWFHDDDWLDFNMLQSGHMHDINANYAMIAKDYAKEPPKPCLDGEPPYEDHPVNWKSDNRYFEGFDARRSAYWAVFAGAHGHTYGCNDVWQLWTPDKGAMTGARTLWWEALDLSGARDMSHVRRLMLSRPFFSRIPCQELIADGQAEGVDHVRATRGKGYAMAYIPQGKTVVLDPDILGAREVRAWWYDPRNGTARSIGSFTGSGVMALEPPSSGWGRDWVAVIDDADMGFGEPGEPMQS